MLTTDTIITIDGPAGAGKSTVARLLAERLGLRYLDTGAMYRAAAWLGVRQGIDLDQENLLPALVAQHEIRNQNGRTWVDDEDVSEAIRTQEITDKTRYAANNPGVRAILIERQRHEGEQGGLVTEGRDQGSVAFPNAARKFYLTATPEARAFRRFNERRSSGENVDYEAILRSINERDRSDSARKVGPLRKPDDAIEIDSSERSIEEVVRQMEDLARA